MVDKKGEYHFEHSKFVSFFPGARRTREGARNVSGLILGLPVCKVQNVRQKQRGEGADGVWPGGVGSGKREVPLLAAIRWQRRSSMLPGTAAFCFCRLLGRNGATSKRSTSVAMETVQWRSGYPHHNASSPANSFAALT